MLNVSQLTGFLEAQLPAALEMLQQMVGINSFTLNRDGITRLSRYTAECFASLGFKAEFVASTNPQYGGHLALTRRGTGSKSVMMVSHLDTVFPPEEEVRNNFRWQVEGDRIFGPGTNDIKGGTTVMWMVLKALQALAPAEFEATTWKLLWNSSEEMFSPDFGELCRSRVETGTLAALVFESEGRLGNEHLMVVARKGRATWRATASGRAAHAGSSHGQGANAIVQLSRTVEHIAALTNSAQDLTVNVATISGGTVLNRVPHEATAEGEFRAFSPEVYERAKAALLGMTGPGEVRAKTDRFACSIRVQILTESRPWPRNPATDRLFELWRQAGELTGQVINCQERGGLSDGNLIWDVVPTLDGLGPPGDNSHCSERSADGSKLPEFVERSSFVPKAATNTLAILKLLASSRASGKHRALPGTQTAS
ncbi:MAG TPA: M20/M25/M40 family metallo-hydrolase [Verrucomicrobiae bacterium]|nr:M20/M25/M40 family metallo-hydrolase [Verrucomicrobiae bacterium]